MQEIKQVNGTGIPLPLDDIDTDRIIPARYLRCVTFDGLGEHAFEDDRQQDPAHPFNNSAYEGGSVLIAGRNFGCGSSREHAPQALIRYGVKAIVAESFAEIFFGNCTTLGVPCMTVSAADVQRLAAEVAANPQVPVTVDLIAGTVTAGSVTAAGCMPESARSSLVSGQWDFLSQLLEGQAEIKATAERLPYLNKFAV